jgi:hypothetical protein
LLPAHSFHSILKPFPRPETTVFSPLTRQGVIILKIETKDRAEMFPYS